MKRSFHNDGMQTGSELAAARNAAGLSQSDLAARAGIGRHAVSYWECKPVVDPMSWAVGRMCKAEPEIAKLFVLTRTNTHARGMGHTRERTLPYFRTLYARQGSYSGDASVEALFARELLRMQERAAQRKASARVRCGATTTRKGTPCRNKSEPGRRRCKFHGGLSTGPKTIEGRERIAKAQRSRWARWRASKIA